VGGKTRHSAAKTTSVITVMFSPNWLRCRKERKNVRVGIRVGIAEDFAVKKKNAYVS
jgi:hypothetical protein